MKRCYLMYCLILTFTLIFAVSVAAVELSADMLIKQGNVEKKGKVYIKGEKQRIEAEGQGITIIRGDRRVAWTIIPEEKSYIDMPLEPNLVQKLDVTSKMKDEVSRKLIGDEIVDGQKTKKYEVTLKSGPNTEKVYQWVRTDMDFPVKMADVTGKWSLEYRNIKKDAPDSAFELPAGYERISVPLPPGFPGIPDDDAPTPPQVPGGPK